MFQNFTLLSANTIKIFIGLLVTVVLLKSTFVFVPAGRVGVVYDRGVGVKPYHLKEGLNLTIPFWQSVTLFDTRLREYTMSIAPDEGALRKDDSLDAPTADGQQVRVDATVLFRIEGDKAPIIYKLPRTESPRFSSKSLQEQQKTLP